MYLGGLETISFRAYFRAFGFGGQIGGNPCGLEVRMACEKEKFGADC